MPKADDYICPRCDYHTPLKRCMSRHFYEKKTPCTDRNGLDLTDEIRGKITVIMLCQHRAFRIM